ncbi:conserved hypothetical protein [Pyrenophora tritici-repentis Pt-1C-BFP]|uniref:Uncharacterized protein n=1 Tax=Pyrenophora tritici-repentis (strain Pt-1C-BFP) TaxID=426418 RepID=B2VS75_PYRTR|nr:uncharacterized protein PTRG_01701 [Pyrenophora tritici-repentis Pt-1C-BFP]EDU41139.1 conserved hypothetical protein [Pyrenophora tritici-repentis Pt-1C-BFP]
MATTPPSSLLDLPREIRNTIYEFYLTRKCGYVYRMPQRRFTGADGRPVDLALTLTCKQIANELEGLPFSLDKLIFMTWLPIRGPDCETAICQELYFSKYEYDQQGVSKHAASRFTKAVETITDRDRPDSDNFPRFVLIKSRTKHSSHVLDEDLVAIAHPASHAQGLIPYCQKNPKMRIEKRVDMWRNLLQGGATPFHYGARQDDLESKMPKDVFTLVLDGGETRNGHLRYSRSSTGTVPGKWHSTSLLHARTSKS